MKTAKIKSIKPIGRRQAYNIEMKSDHHNYVTRPDDGMPVHRNSHSCAYIIVAYWCAWLKAHYAPEWWASVMSSCHHERIKSYMNVARSEGVQFGPINVEDISTTFTVDSETLLITPGLISIKGIGQSAVEKLKPVHKYDNIDDFIEVNGKSKTIMQRLILLGAFTKYHENIKATWMWYLYKYGSGKDVTQLRKEIRAKLIEAAGWDDEKVKKERERQVSHFKKNYPKRKVIPKKILNWQYKPDDSREAVMALYPDDYTFKEKLQFEKEYLGYHWHCPMDLYKTKDNTDIRSVKGGHSSVLEGVVESLVISETRNGNSMGKMTILDRYSRTCTVFIWENELATVIDDIEGRGVRLDVNYNESRGMLSLKRDTSVKLLDYIDDQ